MDMASLLATHQDEPLKYFFGEIEVKSASESKMRMAGFVSTPSVDLSNESVDVNAFDKYFEYYKRNSIYCYHHDKFMPIGRVENPSVVKTGVKTGLYLDDIVLTPLPIVKEYIWPLVLDKVLTQQSIGFMSLDGKQDGKIFRHTEVFMLESSLVPIACNPTATIDQIKSAFGPLPDGYELLSTVSEIMEASEKGLIRLPSEVRRTFAVGGIATQEEVREQRAQPDPGAPTVIHNSDKSKASTPDFADAKVLTSNKTLYDPEGEAVAKPCRNEKGYTEVSDMIHAVKSDSRGSYMFQIGVPTENGFKYDWENVALSMGRVLGAGGGAHFTPEQKSAIVARIAEGYKALDKPLPWVYDETSTKKISVDKADPVYLASLTFKDVHMESDEDDTIKTALVKADAMRIKDAVGGWIEKGELPVPVREVLKDLYGTVDLYMWAPLRDPDALTFMTTMIQMIQQFVTGDNDDATADDSGPFMMSGPEGMRKFADYVKDKADEEARKIVSEAAPPDGAVTVPVDLLKSFLSESEKLVKRF